MDSSQPTQATLNGLCVEVDAQPSVQAGQLQVSDQQKLSTQSDQLFRRGRVNGHGAIEVGFGGAHLQRDGKALNHLVRALADHVDAEHAFLDAAGHELHHRLRLALGDAVVEVHEAASVD